MEGDRDRHHSCGGLHRCAKEPCWPSNPRNALLPEHQPHQPASGGEEPQPCPTRRPNGQVSRSMESVKGGHWVKQAHSIIPLPREGEQRHSDHLSVSLRLQGHPAGPACCRAPHFQNRSWKWPEQGSRFPLEDERTLLCRVKQ